MAKILVIEDDAPIRQNLQLMLKQEGHEVRGAPNGVEGLKQIERERPDLVICDVMMPELDGFGVLQAVRAVPDQADIPFIFLTALDDNASMRRGMNLGADDYLHKPFTREDLLQAVAVRIRKHALTLAAMAERLVLQPDRMQERYRAARSGTARPRPRPSSCRPPAPPAR